MSIQIASEMAIESHRPEKYERRTWPELSLIEQEAAIAVALDQIENGALSLAKARPSAKLSVSA